MLGVDIRCVSTKVVGSGLNPQKGHSIIFLKLLKTMPCQSIYKRKIGTSYDRYDCTDDNFIMLRVFTQISVVHVFTSRIKKIALAFRG